MSAQSTDPVLSLENIVVSFGGNHVLKDLSLTARPGFTGLIGPNGAGKTTTFNIITGYVKQTSGIVGLRGVDVSGQRAVKIARSGIVRTFQTPKLVPELTVVENIMLGLDGRRGVSSKAKRERSLVMLERFGMERWRDTAATSVPIAVQKIVEVMRALVSQPDVILLDEPAAGLSVEDVEQLVVPLQEIVKEQGTAVVIVEHDIGLVSRLCSHVTVLDFGTAIASGTPEEVTSDPQVLQAYLGVDVAAAD